MIINPINFNSGGQINGTERNVTLTSGSVKAGDFITIGDKFDPNIANYTMTDSGSLISHQLRKTHILSQTFDQSGNMTSTTFLVIEKERKGTGSFCFHMYTIDGDGNAQLISEYTSTITIGLSNTLDSVILDATSTNIYIAVFYEPYSSTSPGLRYTIYNYSVANKTYAPVSTQILVNYQYSGVNCRVEKLNNNRLFIVFSGGQESGDGGKDTSLLRNISGMICSYTTSSISKITEAVLNTAATNRVGTTFDIVKLSDTKIFIAFGSYESDSDIYILGGFVCSLDNTYIYTGPVQYTSATNISQGYFIRAKLLSDGRVFITHIYDSSYLGGTFATINNSTDYYSSVSLSGGIILNLTNSGYYFPNAVEMPNNKIYIFHAGDSSYKLYCSSATINGTSYENLKYSQIQNSAYAGIYPEAVKLSDKQILVIHYGESYVTYVSLLSLDQIAKFSSGIASGVAKTNGSAGETVTVYMPR